MSGTVPVHRNDEETPLLSSPTPLPKRQIIILVLLQLSDPLTASVIFPFINQFIRELGVTGGDDRKIGYYVGFVNSLFFVAEACTMLHWGRASDHFGRKPVLLIGTACLCLCIVCVGMSKTFIGLIVSRCLSGALCGNHSVMKSMMADISDETNVAQIAFLSPLIWSIGAIVGPFIGGMLARPHERFPATFTDPFWQKFPYFLPCAAVGAYCFVSFLVAFMLLEESNPNVESRSCFPSFRYRPTHDRAEHDGGQQHRDGFISPRELLIPRVLIPVANYGIFAFLEMALLVLLPLFYATPIRLGGLGLSPPAIGFYLTIYGVADCLAVTLILPLAIRRWGEKRTTLAAVYFIFPTYGLFPVINAFARSGTRLLRWAVVLQLILAASFDVVFSCLFIFLKSCAPDANSGAVYGLSQMVGSFARATAPVMSSSLFAFSIQHNLGGGYAVYVVFLAITSVAFTLARCLPDKA